MTATTETPARLGTSLRQARQLRSLSLNDVAAATGISASFLSLVENDKSDITVGRLVRLVSFYGLSLTDLLPAAPPVEPDIIRKPEQRTLPSSEKGIEFRLLAPNSNGLMMPMIVEFEPRAQLAEYGRHAGQEFVHVLQGRLELELEGTAPRTLKPGDSAYYSAERPHRFRNPSDTAPLRIMCIDSPPNL